MILVYGFVVSLTSIMLEIYAFKQNINSKVILKLILLSAVESIGYRQLISIYRISAFLGYRKYKKQWGTIKRNKNIRENMDENIGKDMELQIEN